jgi:hypothetical protein
MRIRSADLLLPLLLLGLCTSAVTGSGGKCCSTHSLDIDAKGDVSGTGGCDLQPLSTWDTLKSADAAAAWKTSTGDPLWIAFAGDSETRYEFWRLVKMVGRRNYTVSDNFARVAFNVSSKGTQAKVEKDQDPVTVEAKFMDYKFCCTSASEPASCRLETGGDNITKYHASFRKVNNWIDQNTDFTDVGSATSAFLSRNSNGMCITWKMVAYPGPLIVKSVLRYHLAGSVQVRPTVLDESLVSCVAVMLRLSRMRTAACL